MMILMTSVILVKYIFLNTKISRGTIYVEDSVSGWSD